MNLKRLLVALLLLAAAVAPVAAAGLQDDLLAREKALWTAWGEKQGAPTRAQTVEDYVQIFATSIWVRQGGNWVGYSYQETPID